MRNPLSVWLIVSLGSLYLTGTETSGANVNTLRRAVYDCFDTLNIGLERLVAATVGMGNLNTKGNALVTKITLRHSAAPPIESHKFDALQTGALI